MLPIHQEIHRFFMLAPLHLSTVKSIFSFVTFIMKQVYFSFPVYLHAHQLKRTNKMKFPSKGLQTVQQIDSS